MAETDTKPPVRRTKVRPGWFLFVAKKYKLIEKTRFTSFYLAFKKVLFCGSVVVGVLAKSLDFVG